MTVGEDDRSFTVELDHPDARYRAGETLRGHVMLRGVDDRVRGVDLALSWHTEGDGNTDKAQAATAHFPVSALGGLARVPFEIPLPAGPVSYSGPSIQVVWVLDLSVDISWARDPHRKIVVDLLPADPQRAVVAGAYRAAAVTVPVVLGPKVDPAGKPLRSGTVFSLFASSALSVAGFAAHGFGYVVGGVAFAVALAVAWDAALRHRSRTALGAPTFQIVPDEVPGGGTTEARLTITPREPVEIRSAEAQLICEEKTTKNHGKSSTTRTKDVYSRSVALAGPKRVGAGEIATFHTEVIVPPGAAPTFGAYSNSVSWRLKLTLQATGVDSRGHYDIEESLTMHVLPS